MAARLTPEAAAMSRAVVRAYPFSIRQRFAPASRASRFPMAGSILLVLNECLERSSQTRVPSAHDLSPDTPGSSPDIARRAGPGGTQGVDRTGRAPAATPAGVHGRFRAVLRGSLHRQGPGADQHPAAVDLRYLRLR